MSLVIAGRIASMLFFMLPGFILGKKRFIGGEGAGDMGRLLVWFILPYSVIESFDRDFSRERASLLFAAFVISLLALLLSAVISRAAFGNKCVECFCGAFSNAGFMGIPLVSAVMGGDMVFCAAVFTALLNILQWSWGAFMITGDRSAVSIRKVLLNPVTVSFFAGIILFLLPIRLPGAVSDILKTVSQMNAPVAMLIIGCHMAQISFRELFSPGAFKVCAFRLLIIPIVTVLLIALTPVDNGLKLTAVILAAAPAGSNAAVYAQMYNKDHKTATGLVVITTLLSVMSMPAVIQIAGYILQSNPL